MCLAVGVWVGFGIWRASRAVAVAERDVAAAGHFRFTLNDLHPVADRSRADQRSRPVPRLASFSKAGSMRPALPAYSPKARNTGSAPLLPPAPLDGDVCRGHVAGRRTRVVDRHGGRRNARFRWQPVPPSPPADAKCRNVTAVLGSVASDGCSSGPSKQGCWPSTARISRIFHPSLRDIHVTALAGNETDLWIGTLESRTAALAGRAGYTNSGVFRISKCSRSRDRSGWGGLCGHRAWGSRSFETKRVERIIGEGVVRHERYYCRGSDLYVGTLDPGLYEIPLGGGRPHFVETSAAVQRIFDGEGTAVCRVGSRVYSRRGSGRPC